MQLTYPGKAETHASNDLCPLTFITANSVGNFCSGGFWKTYHFPKYQVAGILQIMEKAVAITRPTSANTCSSVSHRNPAQPSAHE